MDLIKLEIPMSFARARVPLDAHDVRYGLENELLEKQARLELTADGDADPEAIRDKWLYLTLAWVFEHQDAYPDPLETVAEIYADFDYPESIAGFVNYMPTTEPDLGTLEANRARLFEKWRAFIDGERKRYTEGTFENQS